MENLINNDVFSVPILIPSQNITQPVNVINCNGLQLRVGRDKAFPYLVLQNSDAPLHSVSDLQILVGSSLAENDISFNGEYFAFPQTREESNCETHSPVKDEPNENVKDVVVKQENFVECEQNLRRETDISKTSVMDNFIEIITVYKCKLCAFTSSEKESVTSHLEQTHIKVRFRKDGNINYLGRNSKKLDVIETKKRRRDHLIYMCGSCNETFFGLADCSKHMSEHHKIPMECDPKEEEDAKISSQHIDSLKDFTSEVSKSEEKIQNLISHCKKTIVCCFNDCLIKFESNLGLQRHQDCHSFENPKGFVCNYCGTNFSKWSLCANHLWKTHKVDVELFSCSKCKYKTATRVKLRNHMQIHGERKEYMCNACGEMFNEQIKLKNHEVSIDAKLTEDNTRWYNKKQCQQCQKIFANSKSLKKHIRAVHSKLRPYVCHVCSHSSASKDMLLMHLRQHTGEKPFSCSSCSFTTGDHNSLRRHRMRHTGVRPYRCPHCPYSSIQSKSLKTHLTWHLADKTIPQTKIKKGTDQQKTYSAVSSSSDYLNKSSHLKHSDILPEADGTLLDSNSLSMELELAGNEMNITEESFNSNSLDKSLNLPASKPEGGKELNKQIPVSSPRVNYLDDVRRIVSMPVEDADFN